MKPITFIDKAARLYSLVSKLSRTEHIAIDTESNSFYAYFERVCLIQVSTLSDDYIIDPLLLEDLEPFGEILANPALEKIIHAASNDILGLKRNFGFHVSNLFDTAIACKLLGYKQLGLAKILQDHFDVTLDKKFQRCDWGRRPLREEQIDYARLDTHYLIPLRHELAVSLRERELWEQAKEAFDRQCEQEAHEKPFHPDGFINIKGARSLDSTGKRILKALYVYRENEAQRRDRAPFRIMSNETLLRLARTRPHSMRAFSQTKGLPRDYRKGHKAQHLIKLIQKNEEYFQEAEAKM